MACEFLELGSDHTEAKVLVGGTVSLSLFAVPGMFSAIRTKAAPCALQPLTAIKNLAPPTRAMAPDCWWNHHSKSWRGQAFRPQKTLVNAAAACCISISLHEPPVFSALRALPRSQLCLGAIQEPPTPCSQLPLISPIFLGASDSAISVP